MLRKHTRVLCIFHGSLDFLFYKQVCYPTALQAATILVAMASVLEEYLATKLLAKVAIGDLQVKRETRLKNYQQYGEFNQ